MPSAVNSLREQRRRAAVDPRAREEMVAGAEQGEQRARRRAHSARRAGPPPPRPRARRPPLHQLGVRRVAVARIAQAVARADLLNEVDRLKERMDDRRVGVARSVAGVDGERREVERARRRRRATRVVSLGRGVASGKAVGRRPRLSRSGFTTRTISDGDDADKVAQDDVAVAHDSSMRTVASSPRRGP